MGSINTETETVIKRILPYLYRRGYTSDDLDFETAVKTTKRYANGYVDILVTCGKAKPQFLIEAKRLAKRLTVKDRDQAIAYAQPLGCLFAVVTNGIEIQVFNTQNSKPITWNGKLIDKIPTKDQLGHVIKILKADKQTTDILISGESSLPYRPGLALRQLNALFARCHNAIRKIEKDEEHAFADFSKLLFLRLLEEKTDTSSFTLPYSYRFHELAEKPASEDDQVKDAVLRMREEIIKRTPYGDVLHDQIYLRNARTFKAIISELSRVSFSDSGLDSKGAAFEYFVRATLKGKKLGQYFTPRNLVKVMAHLVGREKIVSQLQAGNNPKILDPACGTGGFLVYLMQDGLEQLADKLQARSINRTTHDALAERLMRQVFYGSDANPGVASAAKMNMIISGDGHTNIQCEDSLASSATNWSLASPTCHAIFTNPPFGTSESDSLSSFDLSAYPVRTTKGQHLFLQKMVLSTVNEGEICTVIDEGVLNTGTAAEIRAWLLKTCRLIAVVRLPDETFKPNKINVKSSLLYLQKLEQPDEDGELDYKVSFIDLQSLGYEGSGDPIRGFAMEKLLSEAGEKWLDQNKGSKRSGSYWSAFDIKVSDIRADKTTRIDLKYWEPALRKNVVNLQKSGAKTIRELNQVVTSRGTSPSADTYVDQLDGYALVIKAGSNISKYGELITTEADWIEKSVFDEFAEKANALQKTDPTQNLNIVIKGDVLVSSTGDGTLGKCCVFRGEMPAIADGHVAIIRVNPKEVHPEYLADYLRCGFGADQITRLFTGSTGLIELTEEALDEVVVDLLDSVAEQKKMSLALRKAERKYQDELQFLGKQLRVAIDSFAGK